jgi:probable HAF family extracellular repeat protein
MRRLLVAPFVLLVLAISPFGAARSAPPSLQSIGRLSGHTGSTAYGVSADGSVVTGNSFDANDYRHAVRWDATSGLTALPEPIGKNLVAEWLSRDGTTIVGESRTYNVSGVLTASEGFRWTQAEGVVPLGDFSGGSLTSESGAYACTPDGSLVVGYGSDASGYEAARWDADMISLVGPGDLAGGDVDATAYDVSADGSVIVGDASTAQGTEGFRWTAGGGMVGLGDLPGGAVYSAVDGVSGDGSVIVGWSEDAGGNQAVRWVNGGPPQGLGDLPGGDEDGYAYDVTPDGSVIVGESHTAIGYEAFIWDATHGMRRLLDVLAAAGVDVTDWRLYTANAISSDGRTIVGWANTPSGFDEGFVATLPEPEAGSAVLAVAALASLAALARRRRGVA